MRRIIVSIAASAAGLLFLDACGQKETAVEIIPSADFEYKIIGMLDKQES